MTRPSLTWHGHCVAHFAMSLLRLPRIRSRAIWRVGPALMLLFLLADDGIGRDEFQCEVAVVHLTDCCPALPASMLSCTHGGCDAQFVPDLTEDRSACIQSKSCEELAALGACDPNAWAVDPACASPCTPVKVPPCR